MGQAGQEGGADVTDILTGKATPSGKLTATWAKKYEDYPTAGNFLQDFNKAVYTEGIYVGYRYFDTFNVDPGYPFGYGLSYTTFALGNLEDTLVLGVTVENTGAFAGREVVQVYVSAPVSEMDMPEQELKGFQKTMLLAPGEKEDIKIRIPLRNLASYSENAGGYILSKGDYGVRIGTSSRDTKPVCKIRLEQTALTEQVLVELPLTETLEEKKGLTDRRMKLYGRMYRFFWLCRYRKRWIRVQPIAMKRWLHMRQIPAISRLCLTKQYGMWKRKNGS